METVNDEGEELLGILLIVFGELLTAFANHCLEESWRNRSRVCPHLLQQVSETRDQVALKT